jgi:hypothetical protein
MTDLHGSGSPILRVNWFYLHILELDVVMNCFQKLSKDSGGTHSFGKIESWNGMDSASFKQFVRPSLCSRTFIVILLHSKSQSCNCHCLLLYWEVKEGDDAVFADGIGMS